MWVNFWSGELILKLLSWNGDWHQNLRKTVLVDLQCYHVANIDLCNRQKDTVRETDMSYQVILNRSWLFNNMLIPPVMWSNRVCVSIEMLTQTKISKYLKEHMKSHEAELPYKCSLCFKCFLWRSGVKCHKEKDHSKWFNCHTNICFSKYWLFCFMYQSRVEFVVLINILCYVQCSKLVLFLSCFAKCASRL